MKTSEVWIAFTLAWSLLLLFAVSGFGWHQPEYSPEAMATFTADRPFIYRLLVPLLMQPLMWIGVSVESAVIFITALAIGGFVAALWWGWQLSLNQITLILFGALPLTLKQTHIYDLPTLALFAGCLAAMCQGRWGVYFVLFWLACYNRETAILLTVVYVVHFGFDRRAVYQVLVFAAIQFTVRALLSDLPGVDFEVHWLAHFEQYRVRPDLIVLNLMLVAVLLWAVRRKWSEKPYLIRQAALIITPILALSYFVIGFPFEFRIFYEAYTPLALLAVWRN